MTGDCFAGAMPLRRRIGKREKRAGMPGRERARRQVGANLLRQLQEPHEVGDRAAILAHRGCNLLLCQRELVDETLIRQGLIDWIETFALKVLDKGQLEQLLVTVRHISDDDRDALKPRSLRCAPAALTRNDSVCGPRASYEDRLNDAVGFDRRG